MRRLRRRYPLHLLLPWIPQQSFFCVEFCKIFNACLAQFRRVHVVGIFRHARPMRDRVTFPAQRDEVLRQVCSALRPSYYMVYLKVARVVAEGAAVTVPPIHLRPQCHVCLVCHVFHSSFLPTYRGTSSAPREVKGAQRAKPLPLTAWYNGNAEKRGFGKTARSRGGR